MAREADTSEYADAFCLSSIGVDGYPEGRVLLLKGFDQRGPVFYTNLDSNKGVSLRETPRAAATFHWKEIGKQVRIQGDVERVSEADADAYFASRSRGSRIGAWASDQSRVLNERGVLTDKFREIEARFEGQEIPRPENWGGFRILPRSFEFWVNRDCRLHERYLYSLIEDEWDLVTLYP